MAAGTLHGFWTAGQILLATQGIRKTYGRNWSGDYDEQIGISTSYLEHCKRFATHWTQGEVRAAEKRGVSWRCVIALLTLDGLAAMTSNPRRADAIRAQRRALVNSFKPSDVASALRCYLEARNQPQQPWPEALRAAGRPGVCRRPHCGGD